MDKEKFKEWIYSPVEDEDFLFTRIRKTIQELFPCKHNWENIEFSKYKRKCKYCKDKQVLMYSRYGNQRYSWKSISII